MELPLHKKQEPVHSTALYDIYTLVPTPVFDLKLNILWTVSAFL
jgi:hypothetical protein